MTTSAPSPARESVPISDSCPISSPAALPAKSTRRSIPRVAASPPTISSSTPSGSLTSADLVGALLRTALSSRLEATTGLPARWKRSVTPAGRSWWALQTPERPIFGGEHGYLPTPTATANQLCPSMMKHAGCRALAFMPTPTANRWSGLQSHGRNLILGRMNPRYVEWMMGFPHGWVDLS